MAGSEHPPQNFIFARFFTGLGMGNPIHDEGTICLELMPTEWPPSQDGLIFSDFIASGRSLSLHATANGTLRLASSRDDVGLILESCPLHIVGTGDMRIALAWSGERITLFAGGQCIASNDPETSAVSAATITLRPHEQ
ncbi:MAG: hypothetical protein ACKVRO_09455 [Micropepsaceae bacterium]